MNADQPPFFSILIPAYNRPDYLVAAIRSVIEGSFADFEIAISEDRSPGQAAVMAAIAGFTDPRIRGYAQPENLGWSRNRNFLVRQARGRFVWLMGDDDLLVPDALERLHTFITRYPGHDLYACGYEVIDEHYRHQYYRAAAQKFCFGAHDRFAFRQLLLSQALPFWMFHPFTYAYRRELGLKHPYNPAAHIGDDLLFLYESVRQGATIAVTPDILFRWRKFSAAASIAGAQINLSSAANGLKARARILELLETEPAWAPVLARLFPDGDFAARYLWDSLRADSGSAPTALLAAAGDDTVAARRFAGYHNRFPAAARCRVRLGMLQAYLRLNGLPGLRQLLRLALARWTTPG